MHHQDKGRDNRGKKLFQNIWARPQSRYKHIGNDISLRLHLQVSKKNNSGIIVRFYNALATNLSIIDVNWKSSHKSSHSSFFKIPQNWLGVLSHQGRFPFDTKFRCEYPDISWSEWNRIFRLTVPKWKTITRSFVRLEFFNDLEV